MSLEFLRRNLGLKIFSVVLAIFLWAYVKYIQMPQAALSTRSKILVPLSLENKNEKLSVLDAPDQIELTIKGQADTLTNIDTHHFKAFLDLKDKKSGKHQVTIQVNSPPNIEVEKINPEKITIKLDPEEKRLFTVKVKPQGAIAKGFILGALTTKPESVTVSGPQSTISRVKEVQAVCDVEGMDMDRIQQSAVEAVDENGKNLSTLNVEPQFVRVTINVKSEVKTSNVPITPDLTGLPSQGWKIEEVRVEPLLASIRYSYNMESPPKQIKTKPISIKGAKETIEVETGLVIPNQVILVSDEKIKIVVKFSKLKTSPDKSKKPEN